MAEIASLPGLARLLAMTEELGSGRAGDRGGGARLAKHAGWATGGVGLRDEVLRLRYASAQDDGLSRRSFARDARSGRQSPEFGVRWTLVFGTLGESPRNSQSRAPPAPKPPVETVQAPATERRLVTVLFADLVGFTPLSESRDPEEVRELLLRYFDACRRPIELYGGTVEKFIGDAVMAVWGTPIATEDDAERAVRAALDLVAAVSALGDRRGPPGRPQR